MRQSRKIARDARAAAKEGPAGIERRQRQRLRELVAYARAHSPYFRDLYRALPDGIDDITALPVTSKRPLMVAFDDWVTDPAITRAEVEAFVADPALAGHRFLDEYLVTTTSGTSGVRGLFVQDERSAGMEAALSSRAAGMTSFGGTVRMILRRGRTAIVTAPGGHFSTIATAARFRLDHPRLGRAMRVFSARMPLPALVNQLNQFHPAVLSGFLGMLTLLAAEQEAARLHISPVLVVPGGETLTPELEQRLTTVFHAPVRAAYAATECSFLAVGCREGWYHVNSDWAILEPVEADLTPTPPGRPSHTTLLTNLASRTQPIIRYDLDDSVAQRADVCPCGSPFPAIRVQGRAADLLTFPADAQRTATLSPMLLGTLLDAIPGVAQFQLVQDSPTTLRLRLLVNDGDDGEQVWLRAHAALARLLAVNGMPWVTVVRADEPPQPEPGGKFRRVIPLPAP